MFFRIWLSVNLWGKQRGGDYLGMAFDIEDVVDESRESIESGESAVCSKKRSRGINRGIDTCQD